MKFTIFPLLKVGLCFIAGMMVGPLLSYWVIYPVLVTFVIYLSIEKKAVVSAFNLVTLHVFLFSFAFIVGNWLYTQKVDKIQETRLPEIHAGYSVVLDEKVVQKPYGFEVKFIIDSVYSAEVPEIKGTPKLLGKFSLADTLILYGQKGDRLFLEGCPSGFSTSTNPSRFKKEEYYFHKGILQQIHVRQGCWSKIHVDRGKSYTAKLENFRQDFSRRIDLVMTSIEEQAIVKALLLGIREGMPEEVIKSFTDSGTIHVLAVSGLHVGAVLFIFVWGFDKLIRRGRWLGLIKVVVLIFLAFSYVALTGFSASVIRSVIMFSCILIGKTWFKETDSLNILMVCAIWMLMYNPFYIHDLSFQFSYLSLTGILLFQPIVKTWWSPVNNVSMYIWELISVSIAAQMFVFPLAVYYFHQFPMYFIPGSIIAIPLVLCLVYGGFLFPPFLYFDFRFSDIYITIYTGLVHLLYQAMQWIENLSFSVWQSIYFDSWDITGLYIVSFGLFLYLKSKKPFGFYLALCVMASLSAKYVFRETFGQNQITICVYDLRKDLIVDVVFRKTVFTWKSENCDPKTEKYQCNYNRLLHGVEHQIYLNDTTEIFHEKISLKHNEAILNGFRWTFGYSEPGIFKDKTKYDLIIISRNHSVCPDIKMRLTVGGLVILTGDLTRNQLKYWKNYLEGQNIPYTDMSSSGYIELKVT